MGKTLGLSPHLVKHLRLQAPKSGALKYSCRFPTKAALLLVPSARSWADGVPSMKFQTSMPLQVLHGTPEPSHGVSGFRYLPRY